MNNETKNKLIPDLRFPEFVNDGEWKYSRIEDYIELFSGIPIVSEEISDDTSGVPILRGINITEGTIRHSKEIDRYFLGNLETIKKFLVKENDVVISMDGSKVGKNVAIVKKEDENAILIQRVARIRPKQKANIFYIYQHILSEKFQRYVDTVNTSSGIPHISSQQIKDFKIAFPSIDEQQKIASCLSSLDEVIAAHSQKLEALKEHKKGLMQNLFPQEGETVPKKRFPEFLGDGDWVEKSIQKLIDENKIISHLDGNHGALYPKAEEFSKEGIPYISANDFISGIIDFSKCKYLPLSKANKFKKGVAKDGDILFAHNATVGPVAKLNTDFPFVILSTTATYFRCDNKNLINDFLRFALTSPSFVRQYTRVMSQSTRNQIPITAQREFILQIPKPKEQQKIAECLSSLDNSITVQAEKVEQLKLHKKGLMQGLFPKVID